MLDAVAARNPAKAQKAILVLIDSARDDIETVLATRKRLPKLDAPAPLLRPL